MPLVKSDSTLKQNPIYVSLLCYFLHFINTIYIISRNDFYCLFPQVSMTCKTKAWFECKLCKYKTLRRFQTLIMPFMARCFYYQGNEKCIIEIDLNNITHILTRRIVCYISKCHASLLKRCFQIVFKVADTLLI